MRRVLCDLLIVITTISTVEPEKPPTKTAPGSKPQSESTAMAPALPVTDEAPSWCVLYQEFLFVHYQQDRGPVSDSIGAQISGTGSVTPTSE